MSGNGTIPDPFSDDVMPVEAMDQHTISAKQMVSVTMAIHNELGALLSRKVMPPNLDVTPLILKALMAQSRALSFILDELLAARGAGRAIVFNDDKSRGGLIS